MQQRPHAEGQPPRAQVIHIRPGPECQTTDPPSQDFEYCEMQQQNRNLSRRYDSIQQRPYAGGLPPRALDNGIEDFKQKTEFIMKSLPTSIMEVRYEEFIFACYIHYVILSTEILESAQKNQWSKTSFLLPSTTLEKCTLLTTGFVLTNPNQKRL